MKCHPSAYCLDCNRTVHVRQETEGERVREVCGVCGRLIQEHREHVQNADNGDVKGWALALKKVITNL